ncbi:MAG TPA: hypothetical protein VK177_21670 [Flavobacteriales bacterium]|nr:hypothetical protein [Flavobacteriales bacterium]
MFARPFDLSDPLISIDASADANVKGFGAAEKLKSVTTTATSIVTTFATDNNPELASKMALSAATGTLAPPAPPVVADQWFTSDQLPVPPTQNRFAPNE